MRSTRAGLVGGRAEQGLEIRPGVAAVIVDASRRILLHERTSTGGWAVPSGHIEPGESVRAALGREVREETELSIQVEGLVGVYSEPDEQIVTYPDGRRIQFVTTVFRCRTTGGILTDSGEGSRWEWFAPDRLPEPLHPYARRWILDAMRQGPVVR